MKWMVLIVSCVILTSCATQPISGLHDAPGFFMGLIHGVLAPWALIGSVILDIRVYAFPNSGGWYDFGFILGIGAYGGGAAAR